MDKIEEVLLRGVANIISNKQNLEKELRTGKKLNIYFGIDPTSTRIHIGHAVSLRILQSFAELGHHVTFLIGDFTSLIGDTSDKDTERPVLTSEQIEENFKTYKKQAEKVLDFSKIKVVHNSEWLRKLSFEEIVKLTQHFSVGDFVGRELIRKRLQDNKRVGLHEFLYPVMQGYDSYHLDTDLQIGGTDQTFNMQAGRLLQKDLRMKESYVMTTVLLEGTDGRKMSKTWGNAIWLEDEPSDMYAKVMAVNDDLIIQYFTLATNIPLEDIQQIESNLKGGEHPMVAKKQLAFQIVEELHSKHDAQKAAENFEKRVQGDEMPTEIPSIQIKDATTVVDMLVETALAGSKSDAKRLIEQGGVEVNEERVTDIATLFDYEKEVLVKVGKRKFAKVTK